MTEATEIKHDRGYSKEHEWVKEVKGEYYIGITQFAVAQLGEVTLVELEVEVGERVVAGEVFGTVESVKTLSELFSPVSGTVKRINPSFKDHPELLNDDCWGEGWILLVEPVVPIVVPLLTAEEYAEHVAQL